MTISLLFLLILLQMAHYIGLPGRTLDTQLLLLSPFDVGAKRRLRDLRIKLVLVYIEPMV